MATRLDGAGMIDARAGCAMAAPATIPAAPRNSLREQCNFIIGANSRRFFSSMNRNRSGVSKFIFRSHNTPQPLGYRRGVQGLKALQPKTPTYWVSSLRFCNIRSRGKLAAAQGPALDEQEEHRNQNQDVDRGCNHSADNGGGNGLHHV